MKFQSISASDDLTQNMVQEILKYSPLLASYIEFFKKPGTAVSVRSGGTKSGIVGASRALGSDYSAKTVAPTYKTALRKLLGDTVRIDVAYERMGYDLASEMTSQLTQRMRDYGTVFNYMLINGDSTTEGAKEFAGLKELCLDNQKTVAATNGFSLTLGNSDTAKKQQQGFLELLDEVIGKCQGINKVIIANAKIKARINAIAREYINVERNEFGVPIAFYNTIPIIDIGDYENVKDSYAPVIDFTETCGTSNDCTSLYVASFEEEQGVSFATCEGGFTVYPVQKNGNFLESTFELIADSVLIRGSSLSKLEGLKL